MKLSNLSPQQVKQLSVDSFEQLVVHHYIFNIGGFVLLLLSYFQYVFNLTIIPPQFNIFQYFIPNIKYLIEIQQYHLASMHAIFFICIGCMIIRFYQIYPFTWLNIRTFFILENKKFFFAKFFLIFLALSFIIVSQWLMMEQAYIICPHSTATIDKACPTRLTPSDSFIPHFYILGSVLIAVWLITLVLFLIPKEFFKKYDIKFDYYEKFGSLKGYFKKDVCQKSDIIKRKLGGWF